MVLSCTKKAPLEIVFNHYTKIGYAINAQLINFLSIFCAAVDAQP